MAQAITPTWITFAGSEEEAWKCLGLGRSLKRTLTRKPIGVIIYSKVSDQMKFFLSAEFDACFFGEDSKGNGVLPQGKFDSCIFISSNIMVIKNIDGIFSAEAKFGTSSFTSLEQLLENEEISRKFGKLKVDFKSTHPLVMTGKDDFLIKFLNGHPLCIDAQGKRGFSPLGKFENDLINFVQQLCPERFSQYVSPIPYSHPSFDLKDSIAIVGMGCRYPGANSLEEFWSLLERGVEGIQRVPEWRWTPDQAIIRREKIRSTEAGFLSCPVHTFDSKFFNTNAADLEYLDPQQRISLRVVWEALEHACIDPFSLKGSPTGVFGGWWKNDYKEMQDHAILQNADFLRAYFGAGLGPLTARISHFLNLAGPSIATDSACSTSAIGVALASSHLQKGDCDTAIALGVNLLLHAYSLGDKNLEGLIASDGRSKTFDESADGFGRAEGVGVLILKRFPDAMTAGDKIWGVIKGSAVIQEGMSKSMGTPTVEVEARAMELALRNAKVDPADVEFLEFHGTGTPVGDPIEVAAVARAYNTPKREKPLIIGSVKTNIGHTESVCGIAGIQKLVLSMYNELIPKHLNLNKLNPEVKLEAVPATVPLQPIPWKRRGCNGKPRIAGVNSFGITGAQASFIIQEPLPEEELSNCCATPMGAFRDTRKTRIFTFSAKTQDAIQAQIESYKKFLENLDPKLNLENVEFIMHTGRPHFGLRYTAIGSTKDELLSQLGGEDIHVRETPRVAPKICFLFTGQGSQYPGMALQLYMESTVFRTHFDWCDSILLHDFGISLKEAIWGKDEDLLMTKPTFMQLAIFVVEFCLLKLWESWGIVPDGVLGHSMGEFVAAVAAGYLAPEEGIKLLYHRSKLVESKIPASGMLAVETSEMRCKELFRISKLHLDIAAVNSEDQTVVAGDTRTVETFMSVCTNNGVKSTMLKASHAFHSRLLDPILEDYRKIAERELTKGKINSSSSCQYFSSVEGRELKDGPTEAGYWIRNTRQPVRFKEACEAALGSGYTVFIEVGPNPVLSALTMGLSERSVSTCLPSLKRKASSDWDTMLTSLGKLYLLDVPINWDNFHRYTGNRKKLPNLPGYHFDEQPYTWVGQTDEGSVFHPLLGKRVPNASDISIFSQRIKVHTLSYLRDHAMGDKIIFPGAAMAEMLLTAGYVVTQCQDGKYTRLKQNSDPISLKNYEILAPSELNEKDGSEFQVICSKTVDGHLECSVHSKVVMEDGITKWVKNAKALYNSIPNFPPTAVPNFNELRGILNEEIMSNFDYTKWRDRGFKYGPSLQVVQTIWGNPNNPCTAEDNELLASFQTQEAPEDLERYTFHPWLLDPMLQVQFVGLALSIGKGNVNQKNNPQLVIPVVAIDNTVLWNVPSREVGGGYIYVNQKQGHTEAHLYSEDGMPILSMLGTQLMPTTMSNIHALIDAQRKPYPSLAEIKWKQQQATQEVEKSNKLLQGPWLLFAPSEGSEEYLSLLEANKVTCVVRDPKIQAGDQMNSYLKKFHGSFNFTGILYLWSLSHHVCSQEACEPFLYLSQFLSKLKEPKKPVKLIMLAYGQMCTGLNDYDIHDPATSPLVGMLTVLANEYPSNVQCKCVDVDQTTELRSLVQNEILQEGPIDEEVIIAYRNNRRFLPRLTPYRVKSTSIAIPQSPRFRLALPPSNMIEELHFVTVPEPLEELKPHEVEVSVQAYGLNFRDVLVVTKPDPIFESISTLGIDVCGKITRVGKGCNNTCSVGDRVITVRMKTEEDALPSHVVVSASHTLPLPPSMTFVEGATYPTAAITAHVCLIQVAKCRKDDVVLVHTASGGVGLMVIQLCKEVGCTVIVTAGTKRKRNYLRSLGLDYVFNSRNHQDYTRDIQKVLGCERSVTVVLNSLTGGGFKEATLSLCADGARFIEMSKMNVWKKEEVRKLRPDVFYEVVDVSSLPEEKLGRETIEPLKGFVNTSAPLPHTRFDCAEIRGALEYMEKVRHVGKIVVTMPQEIGSRGNPSASLRFPLLNPESTYLITGGLGGIGFELAKWMVTSGGAKNLVLAGRHEISRPEMEKQILKFRDEGKNIIVKKCDVGNLEELKDLSTFIQENLPPLRGIMHAAGLIDDGTIPNQTWSKFQNAFNPKVEGTWNLHELSLTLPHPLEHFVVFSSVTAILGIAGQCNYVAANYYLDALIHYRNSLGLPGLTVNWGQWAQVGMAAERQIPLFRPFSVTQGLCALEHAMRTHKTQVVVYEADIAGCKEMLVSTRGLLSEIDERSQEGVVGGALSLLGSAEKFWGEYDAKQDKYGVMRDFIRKLLRGILRLSEKEEIDDNMHLQDLGFDSLTMVEMRNGFQSVLGQRAKISLPTLRDCKTVAQLSKRLVDVVEGELEDDDKPLAREELVELIQNDTLLPEDIKATEETRKGLVSISKVSNVLITGATGFLGSYILRDLSLRQDIKTIYCIVRRSGSNNSESPAERLRRILQEERGLRNIPMDKVIVLEGEIWKPMFGLESEIYNALASVVDSIFNLSVRADFHKHYTNTEHPESCRVVNVKSFLEVLRLATTSKLKHIYHGSSFVAETRLKPDGSTLAEDFPDATVFQDIPDSSYFVSKVVCDHLAGTAVKERGIPVKVFRFGYLGGDSQGHMQLGNVCMMKTLAFLSLGMMPVSNFPVNMMPVETCSDLSLRVFFNPKAGPEVYNIYNPNTASEYDLQDVAEEMGIPLEMLEPEDFVQKCSEMNDSSNLHGFMTSAAEFYLGRVNVEEKEMGWFVSWLQGNKRLYWSEKLEHLLPQDLYPGDIRSSINTLRRDLENAKKQGVFEQNGIKCYPTDNDN